MERMATREVVRDMMEWYDEGKNPKVREITHYVSDVAANAPDGYSREELFTQGALFCYFLMTKGYIT